MANIDWSTILQLGPLSVVLIYIVVRLERAMNALAETQEQTNQILLLVLRRIGISEDEALGMCGGKFRAKFAGLVARKE